MPGGFAVGTFFGGTAGGASAGAFPVAAAPGSGAFAFAGSTAVGGAGGKAESLDFGGPAFAQSGLPAANCCSRPAALATTGGLRAGSAPTLGLGGTGGSLGVSGKSCQEPCPARSARWVH